MKRFIPITILVLVVGLLAASAAQAQSKAKIFHPQQSALTASPIAQAATRHATQLNSKGKASKQYLREASRRNGALVDRLNALRSKRNQDRQKYLVRKMDGYERSVFGPVKRRYEANLRSAKRAYEAKLKRINRSKMNDTKKRAARANALTAYHNRAHSAAIKHEKQLGEAQSKVNRTRAANNDLYRKISVRESSTVKRLKTEMRKALAGLRDRSRG